jgi:hypothetical protein
MPGRYDWRTLLLVLAGFTVWCGMQPASAQVDCRDTPEGHVCSVSQPIISGSLVPVSIQQQLGLITVGFGIGCSGTLINRYWVLTADHCVDKGLINGPTASMANLTISAAWTPRTARPTRVVRNWGLNGLDIALIFLGAGDLGPANIQLLTVAEPDVGSTVVKYGRGMSAYASAGPPATQATQDGNYRTATFTIQSITTKQVYTLPVNNAGQIGDGGDSGGPDLLLAANNITVGIAGVQSTCIAKGVVPPQPLFLPNGAVNWPWVTGISSCNSAPIGAVAFDIDQITKEVPIRPDMTPVYYLLLGP